MIWWIQVAFAVEPLPTEPSEPPPPIVEPSVEVPPDETQVATEPPAAIPVDAPLPPVQVDTAAEQLLESAIKALVEGNSTVAVEQAALGMARHPEKSASFRAILEIASGTSSTPVEQLPATPVSDPKAEAAVHEIAVALSESRPIDALEYAIRGISDFPEYSAVFRSLADVAQAEIIRSSAQPPVRRRREKVFHTGFDAGLGMGFRMEWTLRAKVFAGVGARLLGNLAILEDSAVMTAETLAYIDLRIRGPWQIEPNFGATWTGGEPKFVGGVSLQYDPDSALQVNFGARVGAGAAILPDVNVGFLW